MANINYIKIVEWSQEDQVFIGSAPNLIGRCCHGKDESKVYKELCVIVNEWLDIHKKDEQPIPEAITSKSFSGKFNLRVGEDLHKFLTIEAHRKGNSLNDYCIDILSHSFEE
jgi:predicted HicB family RNase H-like nuclease